MDFLGNAGAWRDGAAVNMDLKNRSLVRYVSILLSRHNRASLFTELLVVRSSCYVLFTVA